MKQPDPKAVKLWNTWLEVAAALTGLWAVGYFKLPPLALVAHVGLTFWLVVFLAVEIPAAIKKPEWTLSWRIWLFPTWARWLCAVWLGAMGTVTFALWFDGTARLVVVGLVWVALAGWLIAHFMSRGDVA